MTKTVVQFDKLYLDGDLAGLAVPGQTCTYPAYEAAQRHATFLERVRRSGDFIRDAATGARFQVSNVQLFSGDLT